MKRRIVHLCLYLGVLLLLSACTGDTNPNTRPSTWNTSQWDSAIWQ